MTGNETNDSKTIEAPVSEEKKRSFLDAAGDVAISMIDSAASGNRGLGILASGLSAGLETPGYGARKAALADQYARSQREKALHEARMTALGTQNDVAKQQAKEFMANAGTRSLQNAVDYQRADMQYRDNEFAIINKNFRNRLSSDPNSNFSQLTVEEQSGVLNSPAVQNLIQANYFTRELIRSKNGDGEAWGRVTRSIEEAGGKVLDDGKGNFAVEIYDRNIPLTPEGVMQVDKLLSDIASREIKSREQLSVNLTSGNPMARAFSRRVTEILPYMKNNATEASAHIRNYIKELPEDQRVIMVLDQALDDFFDGTISQDLKMQEIQAALPLLSRLGFTVDGLDGDVTNARILDPQHKRSYTVSEFRDYLKENDHAGKVLDRQAGGMKDDAERIEKLTLMKVMKGTQDALGDKTEEGKDRERTFVSLSKDYGNSFVELDVKEQNALADIGQSFIRRAKLFGAIDENGNPVDDVTKLTALDNRWKNDVKAAGLDEKRFFSPVSNILLTKKAQKFEKEAQKFEEDAAFADARAKEIPDQKNDQLPLMSDAMSGHSGMPRQMSTPYKGTKYHLQNRAKSSREKASEARKEEKKIRETLKQRGAM